MILQAEGLHRPLMSTEMPLVPVLAYMEATRIAVNPDILGKQRSAHMHLTTGSYELYSLIPRPCSIYTLLIYTHSVPSYRMLSHHS